MALYFINWSLEKLQRRERQLAAEVQITRTLIAGMPFVPPHQFEMELYADQGFLNAIRREIAKREKEVVK